MKRMMGLGLGLALVALSWSAGTRVLAQSGKTSAAAKHVDLSGTWRLDTAARSSDRAGMPDLLHVEQTANGVTVSDSSGAVLEQIAIGAAAHHASPATDSAVTAIDSSVTGRVTSRALPGRWVGNALQVDRGDKVTQSWSIEKDELVVRTEERSTGSKHGSSSESFYRKVNG